VSVGSTRSRGDGSAEELETVSGGIAVAAGIFFNGPSPDDLRVPVNRFCINAGA